ncbi:MAG: hypothetical protein HOE45_07675 [Gammaproteobacteria bacterium]|nr:hypothetical protein [Gammaproteobacteria bacterium]MBT4146736.1 hypothetical protein [Gammaproteobacteria bacterium]MBT5222419.1 hypothetical protein [Gammaproteobacteria bacterium]MBT5826567.1 hypothetical protein [Gammaproteobacteria bacterium]MBT5965825.1 hypothetical protein [Gammaproteobacteria bacterium]
MAAESERSGFAIRYMAADNRQQDGERGTVIHVSSIDFGHYDLEQKPQGLMQKEDMMRHRNILRSGMKIIFNNSDKD